LGAGETSFRGVLIAQYDRELVTLIANAGYQVRLNHAAAAQLILAGATQRW
jgi:hypothetical protein